MDRDRINFDENGFVTSVSEKTDDGYGHQEGGFTSRESSNFPNELKKHLEMGSVYNLMEIIKKGSQDPILRRAIGEILLKIIEDALPIIKETRKTKSAEQKAREEAKEKAETQPSIQRDYLMDPYGGGSWYYVVSKPDGSKKVLGKVDSFEKPPTISTLEEMPEGDRGL